MSNNVVKFVNIDNPRSLFPLNSTERFLKLGYNQLHDFIYKSVFDPSNKAVSFATCPIVFALKDRLHLRRMLLLDPAATYYMYDFTLRNWKLFNVQMESERQYYGYAFKSGKPLGPLKQYHEFRRRKYKLKTKYKYFVKLDISNCFNSFYHHEIVSFLNTELPTTESQQFGQFLREINSGTSINCFPQGIHPAKALGNSFLSFSETSMELQSPAIIRFLDDYFLFADKISILERDVIVLQQLLNSRALFLNEEKTQFGSKDSDFEERKLDEIKKSLIVKREEICSYDYVDEDQVGLEAEEVEYLKTIIKAKDVAEEDVELALTLLKQVEEEASLLITLVLERYPNLIKALYRHLSDIEDNGILWKAIKKRVLSTFISEFELFWLSRIILDIYKFNKASADLLMEVFKHPCASPIIKAAILEVPDNNYGFGDLKLNQLRSGAAGIIASSAVAGLENLEKAKRNQIYKYVSKTSPYLHTLCKIMSKA